MHRQFNCGAISLKEYIYHYKGMIVNPRPDISTFQDIIDEAKLHCTFIPQKTLNLAKVFPCIVKFNENHFVLVHGVNNGEVYYSDNGLACRLSLDDFYYHFKGFVLSEKEDCSGQILKEEDCVKIHGEKKGKDIFAQIIPMVVGALAAPLTGGMSIPMAMGVSGLAAAGSSALTQKFMSSQKSINPLTTALAGLGGAATGLGMAPGVAAAKTGAAGTTAGFGGKLWAGGRTLLGMAPASAAATAAGSWGSVAGTAPYLASKPLSFTGAVGNTLQGSSMGNLVYQTGKGWVQSGTPAATTTGTAAPAAGGVLGALTSKPGQTAMSLLSSGLSSGVKMPEFNPDTTYLREASQKVLGGSPLSNLATERAMQVLSGQPLTSEDEQAILNIYNQREEDSINQVDKTYQQYGRLGSEEHKSERQKVKDYWNTQRAYGLQTARTDAQQMQNNLIQGSWGYNTTQVNELLSLAEQQGQIEDIKYAIKAGDTNGIKQIFDKLAQILWPSGNAGNTALNLLGAT